MGTYWCCGSEQQEDDTYVPVTTLCDLRTGQSRQTLRGYNLSSLVGVSLLPRTRLIGLTSDGEQFLDVETGQRLHKIEMEELPSIPPVLSMTPDAPSLLAEVSWS